MLCLRPLLLLCFATLTLLSAADEWAMRWRVYNDIVGGVSFRYPYEYFAPNQYKGELVRNRNAFRAPATGEGEEEIQLIEVDGKMV